MIHQFSDWVALLDDLCKRRAEKYPTRDETYHKLSDELDAFSAWLAERPIPPLDEAVLAQAEQMQPLFICGFYKSGTSFLLNLLDAHPAVSALPGDAKLLQLADQTASLPAEEQFTQIARRWVHVIVNPTGLPPFWLFGREEAPFTTFLAALRHGLSANGAHKPRIINAVARAFMVANPQRPTSPRYWLDKTPFLETDIHRLTDIYPNAKFIHIARNPLAVLAAMKTMAVSRGEPFRLNQTINHLGNSLRLGIQHQQRLGVENYIHVRYEDLLTDTESAMRQIAQTLGVVFHPTLLEPTINALPSTPNSAYSENRKRGVIQKQSLEKWRTHLTQFEVNLIVSVLSDEAYTLGYDWSEDMPPSLTQSRMKFQHQFSENLIEPVARFGARAMQSVRYRLTGSSK